MHAIEQITEPLFLAPAALIFGELSTVRRFGHSQKATKKLVVRYFCALRSQSPANKVEAATYCNISFNFYLEESESRSSVSVNLSPVCWSLVLCGLRAVKSMLKHFAA